VGGLALAHSGRHLRGATVLRTELRSRYVGRTLEQELVAPRGGSRGRPLLVLLHWRGGSPDRLLSNQLFAALARLGPRAPAILLPSGGGSSFFHDRRDGRWAQYVMNEAIPAALRRLHADPRRVAIGGTSMGGFGALDIARLNPGRFCAVGGHSAAIFSSARQAMAGAFDGPADFARNDLLTLARRGSNAYGRTPVWLDVGTSDRFRGADVALAHALRADGTRVGLHFWSGKHGSRYWRSHMGSYLSFYANALARCEP
jgi:S-formylglutathione hydrolase FrmB